HPWFRRLGRSKCRDSALSKARTPRRVPDRCARRLEVSPSPTTAWLKLRVLPPFVPRIHENEIFVGVTGPSRFDHGVQPPLIKRRRRAPDHKSVVLAPGCIVPVRRHTRKPCVSDSGFPQLPLDKRLVVEYAISVGRLEVRGPDVQPVRLEF